MAQLGATFDPGSVPADDRNFDTIPAGTYQAQIVESSVVDTKKAGGKMLKLTWEVVSGPYERRKFFGQINIVNQSAEAQRIGQRELADICEATGSGAISDSEQLHYKPCSVRIAIEKQEGFDDKNVVKRVKPLGNVTPMQRQAPAAQQHSAPVQQKAAAGTRPWSR